MRIHRFNTLNESSNYDYSNYNCIVTEDISEIIEFFLEDLKVYNENMNITMNESEIQKCIDIFKEQYNEKDTYYSGKDRYEEITLYNDENDEYFEDLVSIVTGSKPS